MAKGVTIVIEGDGESAKRALEMVQESLKKTGEKAEHEGSRIVESTERVKAALESVGVYLGVREAIDLMKEMVAGSVELGMEIGHLSKETGISAQNLSVLKYASDMTGVSFEALTKGSLKLSKVMLDAEEGKKLAIDSFARLGISQDEVKAKANDLYGMLGDIAEGFQKIPDGPQKAATAIGLFGKAGAALIPFLNQGAAGMQELRGQAEAMGLVLDESGIQKMEELHEATARLKGGLEGMSLQITEGMTPALVEAEKSFEVASGGASTFQEIGEGLGVGVKVLASAWDLLTLSVHQTTDKLYLAGAEAIDSAELVGNAIKLLAQVADNPLGSADYLSAAKSKMAMNLQDMKTDFAGSLQVMSDDRKRFEDQMDALWSGKSAPAPKPHRGGHGGAITPADQTGGKIKSDDSIDRAEVSLAEAQAEAMAAAIRAANARMIAELDDDHKAQLIADSDFYRKKLQLEEDSLAAEGNALRSKQGDLQALYNKQHGDKNLFHKKDGTNAEELRTKQQLVAIEEKLNALAEKRATLDYASKISEQTRADDVRLATARMAAAVEEQTNTTITARLALLRLENQEELDKIGNSAGKGSPEYAEAQALEQLKEAKLQIGDINRQITDTENDYKRAVEELNDAASKDPRLKTAAQKQINALNAQEAAQLRDLVAQYDVLAATLGGPYIEAAKNLHAELDKLSRPDQRDEARFSKSLVTGVEDIGKRIADSATRGRESFHQMAVGIGRDLLDLAIKLAEQKWLTPLLLGSGGQLPNVGPGGGTSAIGLLGAAAPSLLGGKSPAANATMLGQLGGTLTGGGGGKSAPDIKIMITNATSQPVTARQTGSSFSGDAKEFIVHTVLENASTGGALAGLFG